jgi:hypothetical protein
MKNQSHQKKFITETFGSVKAKHELKNKAKKVKKSQNTQLRIKAKVNPEEVRQDNIKNIIQMHEQTKLKQNVL